MSILRGRDGYDPVAEFTERTERALKHDAGFRAREMRPIEPSAFTEMLLDEFRDKDVLDIGCGYGKWAAMLAPVAKSYTGVDIVADRVQYCREHVPGAEFLHVDDCEFWLGRDFDCVLIVTVLQHLPLGTAYQFLETASVHCRKGGSLYLREAWIIDGTPEDAEREYAALPKHMIPKPYSKIQEATPAFRWQRLDNMHFKATKR